MNKFRIVLLAILAVFLLSSCGADPTVNNAGTPGSPESLTQPVAVEQETLEGNWVSVDPEVQMAATVVGDTITVNWASDDVTALYWKGSAPTEVRDDLVFTSAGDLETMSTAMMASTEEEKTFTYSKDELSFGLSIVGITQIIRLKKE